MLRLVYDVRSHPLPLLKLYITKHQRFHTCSNHSKEGHRIGNQLDHLGIVIVIWGSAIPSDYFGFYCDQKLQYFYWTMVCYSVLNSLIFPTLTYTGDDRCHCMRNLHHAPRLSQTHIPTIPFRYVRCPRTFNLRARSSWGHVAWLGDPE